MRFIGVDLIRSAVTISALKWFLESTTEIHFFFFHFECLIFFWILI